jgi:hypothetical protein
METRSGPVLMNISGCVLPKAYGYLWLFWFIEG